MKGIYDDVCPANHVGRICGHDAGGKQILCGPACPQRAACYDPSLTSVVAGVYGNMLFSANPPASVNPSLKMWDVSMIFSKSAALVFFEPKS